MNYDGGRGGRGGVSRFTQPDTIIPNPTNPQDLNRYSYVRNGPTVYNDPTGHGPNRCDYDPNCEGSFEQDTDADGCHYDCIEIIELWLGELVGTPRIPEPHPRQPRPEPTCRGNSGESLTCPSNVTNPGSTPSRRGPSASPGGPGTVSDPSDPTSFGGGTNGTVLDTRPPSAAAGGGGHDPLLGFFEDVFSNVPTALPVVPAVIKRNAGTIVVGTGQCVAGAVAFTEYAGLAGFTTGPWGSATIAAGGCATGVLSDPGTPILGG